MSQKTNPVIELPEDISDNAAAFLRYWDSLRNGRLVPDRGDINPSDIVPLLPHVVIHELIGPDDIKLRLIGTAVVEHYGLDATGKNYLDYVAPERRPKASGAIFALYHQPAAMLVSLKSTTEYGSVILRESVGVPVADPKGGRKLVYFCSSRRENDGVTPHDTERLVTQSVITRRYIDIGAGVPDISD